MQHDVVAFETALNSKSQVSTILHTECVSVCATKRLAHSSSLTKLGGARPVIASFSHLSNRYTHELVAYCMDGLVLVLVNHSIYRSKEGDRRAQLPVREIG